MGTTYQISIPLERENYSSKRRFFDIWAFVIKLLAGFWLDGKSWSYPELLRLKIARPNSRLSGFVALCWLRPTFIKIGLFSTRAVYFPANT